MREPSRLLVSLTAALFGCVEDHAIDQTSEPVTATPGSTYQLVHQASGLCLDVPGFSKSWGALYQGYSCKTDGYVGNQQLMLDAVSGGYRLRGFDSQLCADLPSSSTADGTTVQQYGCNGGANQTFTIQPETMGYIHLSPLADSTKCLYLDTSVSPSALRVKTCSALAAWTRSFAFGNSKTYYAIKLSDTGQCLDMPGYTSASGATPQLYTCKTNPNDTQNQEWTMLPVGDGSVRLQQRHAGQCFDLQGGSLGAGTIVVQEPCTNATTQRWRVLEDAGRYKLQNVASGMCTDFYSGALRQWTCSDVYSTQLYLLSPGLSGGPTGITAGVSTAAMSPMPQASYATDTSLTSPTITSVQAFDNAITFTWTDPNGAATSKYLGFVYDTFPSGGGVDALLTAPAGTSAAWIDGMNGPPLAIGDSYIIDLTAESNNGVSPWSQSSRVQVTMTDPTVRVGIPASGTTTPQVTSGFAYFDGNGNGIVDGAPGSGGAFPRFPSSSGASTVAATGNQFASAGSLRANLVLGYYMREPRGATFVALHIRVDPVTNAGTLIAALYGDLSGAPGSLVWVNPPNNTISRSMFQVTNGTAQLPNTVTGGITGGLFASDTSSRIVDFNWSLAIDPSH
jgi:hypothetical protein